jgi:hypothetical protein
MEHAFWWSPAQLTQLVVDVSGIMDERVKTERHWHVSFRLDGDEVAAADHRRLPGRRLEQVPGPGPAGRYAEAQDVRLPISPRPAARFPQQEGPLQAADARGTAAPDGPDARGLLGLLLPALPARADGGNLLCLLLRICITKTIYLQDHCGLPILLDLRQACCNTLVLLPLGGACSPSCLQYSTFLGHAPQVSGTCVLPIYTASTV